MAEAAEETRTVSLLSPALRKDLLTCSLVGKVEGTTAEEAIKVRRRFAEFQPSALIVKLSSQTITGDKMMAATKVSSSSWIKRFGADSGVGGYDGDNQQAGYDRQDDGYGQDGGYGGQDDRYGQDGGYGGQDDGYGGQYDGYQGAPLSLEVPRPFSDDRTIGKAGMTTMETTVRGIAEATTAEVGCFRKDLDELS